MTDQTIALAMVEFGRICLGGLFVVAGTRHFFEQDGLTAAMRAAGVPLPRITLLAGSAFQIVAGALLMADLFTVAAASGLVAFTIAATLIFLRYWRMPSGAERERALNGLLSNIGVIGGLLIAAGISA